MERSTASCKRNQKISTGYRHVEVDVSSGDGLDEINPSRKQSSESSAYDSSSSSQVEFVEDIGSKEADQLSSEESSQEDGSEESNSNYSGLSFDESSGDEYGPERSPEVTHMTYPVQTPRRIVSWKSDPANDERLLDWIDTHPREREVMFSSKMPPRAGAMRKVDCYIRLAVYFFQKHKIFHCELASDFGRERLADLISSRLANLKIAYQRALSKLGASSTMTYEELAKGARTRQMLREIEEELPIWGRLHVYWRKLPNYNSYAFKSSERSLSRTQLTRPYEDRRHERAAHIPEVEVRSESMTPGRVLTKPHATIPTLQGASSKVAKRRIGDNQNNPNDGSPIVSGTSSKRRRLSFTPGEDFPLKREYSAPLTADTETRRKRHELTVTQRHQVRMAEIRLEERRIDLEEKKIAAKIRHAELKERQSRREERRREEERSKLSLNTSKRS